MREGGSEGGFKGFLRRNKKRIIVIGVIVLVLLALGLKVRSCSRNLMAGMEPPMAMMPSTTWVERGDVQRLVYATGSIMDHNTEEITAEVSDKVLSVLVYEGQEVKAGDPLYTIDDSEAGLVIRKDRITWQKKQKDLTEQIAALRSNEVYAKVGGVVKSVEIKEGGKLELDAVIATVSNNDILEMQAPLNAAVAEMLTRGQTVTVYIKDFHQLIDATITKIDGRPTVTAAGGVVYMASLQIKNPGALQAVHKEDNKDVGDYGRLQIEVDGTTYTSIGFSPLLETEDLQIEAKQAGVIDEIHIKQGDVITPGSLILTLDAEEQALALQTAQIELEQGTIEMALKEKNYAKYFGVAGIDGVVSEINVEEGKAPPAGKAAVIISGHGPLKMRLEVDEDDIGLVALGQDADVYAGSFGDRSFPGTVSRVAARGKVDNNDVYFEVDITINDPGALKPGMTGDADIYTEKKTDVLRLPVGAVSILDTGVGMVQVVIPADDAAVEPADGELPAGDSGLSKREAKKLAKQMEEQGMSDITMPVTETREIVIGVEGDEYIEIVSGLEEGDEVVMSGGGGGNMGYGGYGYGLG